MVLRKPYAFFIKHFKLFHVILATLVIYSIIRMTGVISFIDSYMDSNTGIITVNDFHKVYGVIDFIVPIITLAFSLLLLVVMGMKKKPNKFYAFSTLMTLILLIVNIYGYSTLKELTVYWLDVNKINTLGDIYIFVLLGSIVESAVAISRAIGFNVSRFDFNNDILELELSEKDNEEFEVMVDFDVNDLKRDAQKKIRYFKYFLKQNKKTILWSFAVLVVFIGLFVGFSFYKNKKNVVSIARYKNSYNNFSIALNNSYIVNTDTKGNLLNDNKYLLVLDVTLKNNDSKTDRQFMTGTIGINIGEDNYTVVKNYSQAVSDFGIVYTDDKIKTLGETRKLLVFDIPENRLNSTIYFTLRNLRNSEDMFAKIKPIDLTKKDKTVVEKKITEELVLKDFDNNESKIKFDSYELSNYYSVKYNYCTTSKKCINSLEYILPDNSMTNYDKTILKLNGTVNIANNSNLKNLYNIIKNYGYIEYEVSGKKYTEKNGLEYISSKKTIQNNTFYIGVNNNILKADKIVLVFTLRNNEYRYTLKERG